MSFARDRQTIPILEQLERAIRWYKRLQALYEQPAGHNADDFMDYIIAVFQNVFACRDWMLNAPVFPGKEDVGKLFESPELMLCRDICNGTKHLTINKPSVDSRFLTVREHEHSPGPGTTPEHERFVLFAAGKKHDLLGLAGDCLAQVKKFVQEHGLAEGNNELRM